VEVGDLDAEGFNLDLIGFDDKLLGDLLADPEIEATSAKGNLADRFMLPPFTVLNAREGWWQDRKRGWLSLGIKSELGRGGGATWGVNPDNTPTPRRAAAHGLHVITAINNAATAQEGQ
jgi:hypothetical protein